MRKPFFKKSHNAWYVWHNGKPFRLASTKKEAFERWHEIRIEPVATIPVVKLVDEFLDWIEQNRAPKTYTWYFDHLQSFAQHIGKRLSVADLRPHHVTGWIKKAHSGNTDNTIHGAMRSVQRVCNWSVKQGYILRSPLVGLEKPQPTSRETTIPFDSWEEMLGMATDQPERDLLTVMRDTGCRPQEIRIIEAWHFEEDERRIVFPARSSKGKRHNRVVYLTDRAFDIIRRLCEENPAGPIFRNSLGKPWTKNAIRCRFRKFKKLDIDGLCATAIRHTYTTDALKKGVNPVILAELLGHVDVSTLSRNYAHLFKDPELLREQAKKAIGEDA